MDESPAAGGDLGRPGPETPGGCRKDGTEAPQWTATTEDEMRFQLRITSKRHEVVDVRTGQVRYSGSLDGARATQAALNAQAR